MAVNVDSKCWIIALFIRDDGERLVLGDGAYDFKDKQQHFKANAMVNDTVDVQGNDGTLIAGQVRRASTQSFDGYIGDATVNQPEIEGLRRDFIGFFSKNHFYKVIYVMPDGTAVKRQRGFIVDAPEVKELWQIHPEYHVALNFEDVNYYNYNENEDGEEVYSQIVELTKAGAATGGLVWDEYGATIDNLGSTSKTVTGTTIEIDDAVVATFQSIQLNSDTIQNGSPTPSSPIPVQTVSGRQVITINGSDLEINLGKNIFDKDNPNILSGYYLEHKADNNTQLYTATGMSVVYVEIEPNTTYTISKTLGNRFCIATNPTIPEVNTAMTLGYQDNDASSLTITSGSSDKYLFFWVLNPSGTTTTLAEVLATVQVEKGSTASSYAAYFTPIKLCKIGTAQDYIYQQNGSWWLHKETDSTTLTSSIGWYISRDTDTYFRFGSQGNFLNQARVDSGSVNIISDYFLGVTQTESDSGVTNGICTKSPGCMISVPKTVSEITDVATLQSWLGDNLPKVYYALATPTDTQITNTALVNQLEAVLGTTLSAGSNTISVVSPYLPSPLEIGYLAEDSGTGGGFVWEEGGGSSVAIAQNDSIDYVYPVITIPGPVTDPVIENLTTNQTISYDGTIGDGQTLVLDTTAQTAKLNGLNVISNLSGDWMSLAPGSNRLVYTTDSSDSPNAKIEWSEVVG